MDTSVEGMDTSDGYSLAGFRAQSLDSSPDPIAFALVVLRLYGFPGSSAPFRRQSLRLRGFPEGSLPKQRQ